jgi:hypothetical protein
MILDLYGQPLVMGIARGTLCDRPGLEDAVVLETQIVMEPTCGMFLNNKPRLGGSLDRGVATGLRRLF